LAQGRGPTDEAVALLDGALERYPLEDVPVQDRPYPGLIQAYALNGRADRARSLYEDWEREVPANLRPVGERFRARGFIAMAEGASATAVEEFRNYYDAESCSACALYPLGHAYDALGDADSALAILRRGLDVPDPYRALDDWLWRAATLIRVGELYEARGEPELAVQRYNELIELWREGDPEAQAVLQDLRERIARLVGEPQR